MIGDGNNVYDFTYVENVAHAHICAERALASGGDVSERASGQVILTIRLFRSSCMTILSDSSRYRFSFLRKLLFCRHTL